ncbi:hypothetical protein [Rubrivirga sp.]
MADDRREQAAEATRIEDSGVEPAHVEAARLVRSPCSAPGPWPSS